MQCQYPNGMVFQHADGMVFQHADGKVFQQVDVTLIRLWWTDQSLIQLLPQNQCTWLLRLYYTMYGYAPQM